MTSERAASFTSKDLKCMKKDDLIHLILKSQNFESPVSKSILSTTASLNGSTTDDILDDSNRPTCTKLDPFTKKDFETILDEKLEKYLKPLEQKISSLIESHEILKKRCDFIQNEINELKVEKKLTLNEMMNEMEQRQLRRMNVIIAGIEESCTGNIEERKAADEREVFNIFRELNAETADIASMRRIGRPGAQSARLLHIRLRNFETRTLILRNAKQLKHSHAHKKVYVNKDLTQQQQKEQRALRQELEERRKRGEDVVIFRNEVKAKSELKNFH